MYRKIEKIKEMKVVLKKVLWEEKTDRLKVKEGLVKEGPFRRENKTHKSKASHIKVKAWKDKIRQKKMKIL